MSRHDNPVPQALSQNIEFSENREPFGYTDINQVTRSMIEGPSYNELPEEFMLEPKIARMLEEVRLAMEQRRPVSRLAEAREKFQAYYGPNPQAAQDSLQTRPMPQDKVKYYEFSQKAYLNADQVNYGEVVMGEPRSVSIKHKTDVNGKKAIADVHSHPTTSPFSRNDIAAILGTRENSPEKCMYLVAAGDLNLAAVICSSSPRLPIKKFTGEMRLNQHPDDYYAELDELAKTLGIDIPDQRNRTLTMQFVDMFNQAQQRNIGIFAQKIEEGGPFKKIDSLKDVLDLVPEKKAI